MNKLIIAAIFAFTSLTAQAGRVTGNEYLIHDYSAQSAYIVGTLEATTTFGKTLACVDQNTVSYTQLQKIVDKYLADHPEQLHLEMIELIPIAFEEAFHCKQSITQPRNLK